MRDVFDVMQAASGGALRVLLADGGVTRNAQLMQFQADILGVPVQRNNTPELSALGAAYLAGLATGVWASTDDLAALPRSVDRFEPRLAADRARAPLRAAGRRPSPGPRCGRPDRAPVLRVAAAAGRDAVAVLRVAAAGLPCRRVARHARRHGLRQAAQATAGPGGPHSRSTPGRRSCPAW